MKSEGQSNPLIDPIALPASAITLESGKARTAAVVRAPMEDMAPAEVESNTELVNKLDKASSRSIRLVTLTLPTGKNYNPGDHVDIFPENTKCVACFYDYICL